MFLRIFLLIFLASPFFLTAQNDDAFLKDFSTKWANATNYSMEVLKSMPEEYFDFKPTPEIRSFGEQMNHSLQNVMWLASTYLSSEEPIEIQESVTSKAALIELTDQVFTYAKSALLDLNAHDLRTEVRFFAGPMSRRKVLMLLNDHLTHHRGQMIIYLRLKGIEPPRYRGW